MTFCLNDTIAALASAPGAGLRGIIRVSGPEVVQVLDSLEPKLPSQSSIEFSDPATDRCARQLLTQFRRAQRLPVLVPLTEDHSAEKYSERMLLPVDLYLWPNSRSLTGEPLAELHLPGSPPLLNELLERIYLAGARPAQRGEFTLRAFLSGRIDLVQAEAVLGVIDAESPAELRTALDQLAGGISARIAEVHEQLLLHLADLEAGLDFVEEDIEFVSRSALRQRLESGRDLVQGLLEQSQRRMLSDGRWRVVLGGLPNAGKSTLFNRLSGNETAIVSSRAGTTRDWLMTSLNWDGTSLELVDTAGWLSGQNGIEAAADDLRQEQYGRARLLVWCTPADLNPVEAELDEQLVDVCRHQSVEVLRILTKSDVPAGHGSTQDMLRVSAASGEGLDDLREAIVRRLSTGGEDSDIIGATAARCADSLAQGLAALERALALSANAGMDELIAVELREVLEHLGRVAGRIYTDDILDRIFSRFCIGK